MVFLCGFIVYVFRRSKIFGGLLEMYLRFGSLVWIYVRVRDYVCFFVGYMCVE